MKDLRTIKSIYTSQPQQVGDGFIGKNAFHPQASKPFSPFLLLDHHGPMQVQPSLVPKGVDEHPHRGFETVTIVYEGALEHRDSAGNSGKLFPGDVQWMTAASGLVHEEKHEKEFSKKGGILNFVQLWVNLPAKYKMAKPRYQEIKHTQFPVSQVGIHSKLRVLAGELEGMRGPVQTFSPVTLADLEIEKKENIKIFLDTNQNFFAYLLHGSVSINNTDKLTSGQLVLFERDGEAIQLEALESSKLLLLGGESIEEPLATYGPFVMNTQQELMTAVADFQAGKMGRL